MGQAAKYAVLAVAFAVVIGAAAVLINSVSPNEVLSGFTYSLTAFISGVGLFFQNVRGALNYVFGSPLLLNIALVFWLGVPITRAGVKLVIMVYRWFNQ